MKSKTVTVHCSGVDYILIKNMAGRCNVSMSEFLLKAGLGINLEAKFTDEEIQLFGELVRMGNNLNQIAKRLNENRILRPDMLDDLERFSNIIKKFK